MVKFKSDPGLPSNIWLTDLHSKVDALPYLIQNIVSQQFGQFVAEFAPLDDVTQPKRQQPVRKLYRRPRRHQCAEMSPSYLGALEINSSDSCTGVPPKVSYPVVTTTSDTPIISHSEVAHSQKEAPTIGDMAHGDSQSSVA